MNVRELRERIVGLTITDIESEFGDDDEEIASYPREGAGVMIDCHITLDDGSTIMGPPLMWWPKENR